MADRPRGLVVQLVSACLSLMVAAIALSVVVTVIRPYLGLLAVVAVIGIAFVVWRAWQRSRW